MTSIDNEIGQQSHLTRRKKETLLPNRKQEENSRAVQKSDGSDTLLAWRQEVWSDSIALTSVKVKNLNGDCRSLDNAIYQRLKSNLIYLRPRRLNPRGAVLVDRGRQKCLITQAIEFHPSAGKELRLVREPSRLFRSDDKRATLTLKCVIIDMD